MFTKYCTTCKADRGFKRNLGWGTFFMMLLTMGFWIFTIPFYPKRCIICGSTKSVWKKDIFASKPNKGEKVYAGADAWDHLKSKDDDATKKCPYCAETIKQAAIICRFCKKELTT